jgi:hypothetical protein
VLPISDSSSSTDFRLLTFDSSSCEPLDAEDVYRENPLRLRPPLGMTAVLGADFESPSSGSFEDDSDLKFKRKLENTPCIRTEKENELSSNFVWELKFGRFLPGPLDGP